MFSNLVRSIKASSRRKLIRKLIKNKIDIFNSMGNYYCELFDLLHISEVKSNSLNLIRTGSANDGGYIMLDDFHEGGTAYSFGIAGDVSWDKYMVSMGYDIFMYDHTIEKLPEENPHFHFFKKGVCGAGMEAENLHTIEYFVKQNNHYDRCNMLLKMDIENSEWNVLNSTSSEILGKFAQMTFEFHKMINPDNPELIIQTLRKINQTHKLIHLHPNNNGACISFGGKIFCDLLEASYVIRGKYEFNDDYDVNLPLEIDHPNVTELPEINLGRWNNYADFNKRIHACL